MYDIIIEHVPASKKIKVFSILIDFNDVSITDAARMVTFTPVLFKHNIRIEQASAYERILEEAGAKILIKKVLFGS